MILAHLRDHAPALFAHTDPTSFGLARPLDVCHAAITPAVRQAYVPLANGTFALALDDAYVTNDPLTGQGANTASHAAWVVGKAICTSGRFDEALCRHVEQQFGPTPKR